MNGLDLSKALTDIDLRYVEETDERFNGIMSGKTEGNKTRRRFLRPALLAACLVVLLAGTVMAGAKALKNIQFLELIGIKEPTKDLEEAIVTKDITAKIGDVTVTLENIIVDKHIIYAEISTDYALDKPDGWITGETGCYLEISGEADNVLDEHSYPGCMQGVSRFCKDGKLWYWYVIEYMDENVDLGHAKMQLTVKDVENHKVVFKWTNYHDAKSEVIPVNRVVDGITILDIRFSLTEMVIKAKSDQDAFVAALDYIKLDDGTVLYYSENNGIPVHNSGEIKGHDGDMTTRSFHTLLSGFGEKDSTEFQFVPYERIVSVSINGTEIPIR
ncbi:MAG: hypothetical protein IK055_02885 [Lachnospiraceae bacterium]|nr:hypothetical protein [Lachnospiraceae bacterium]